MKTSTPTTPLLPLIELAKSQRGMKSKVLVRVIEKGGTANWGQISDWLHPDEKKRRVPRHETLAVMLEVQKEMLKHISKERRARLQTAFNRAADPEFMQRFAKLKKLPSVLP